MSAPEAAPTTRFGRLEAGGVLLGLSAPQLVVVAVAVLIAVSAVYSAGMVGLVASAPLWGLLVAAGTVRVGGRAVVGWVPLLGQWHLRRLLGSTTGAAVAPTRPVGESFVLPGLAGRYDVVECPELAAAVVADRRAGTLSAAVRVSSAGFLLVDAAEQEHKVAAWGRVLAALCQQPSVVRVQLLTRTRPGGLVEARQWWRSHCARAADGVQAALAAMLDESFVEPQVRETFLVLALRAPRGRRPVSAADLDVVAKTLHAFRRSLEAAELDVAGWLGRHDLARVLAAAYDPGARARGEAAPASWPDGTGVSESWRALTTGTAVHATYWVAEWPRAEVHPGFLQPVLLGEASERTVTITVEPRSTTKALREIRRAKVEHAADAAQRTRIGQVENESTRAEVAELERREAELVAGHGDLRFTGLITVTAANVAELEQRCVAMETAAAQAMCEVRQLVGQQGVAHAAACLPLARGVL